MSEALFDLAIIGGGPAGALLAGLTAKAGRKVLLLEASEHSKRKICGEYLCPKASKLLQELKLSSTVEARTVRGMRLFSPSGISVDSRFPGGETGITSRRNVLDSALLDFAAKAGATVLRGKRVEKFQLSEGSWTLLTECQLFQSRLLVGADGRQSTVARQLGVAKPVAAKRVALHFFARTEEETGEWGEMHILSDGSYAGISPSGPHELNISLIVDAEKLKRGGPRETFCETLSLSENLRQRFLPLSDDDSVLSSYPISHAVSRVAGTNWALVGDAAGFLDPLTGEGIYQALESAQLLAGVLQMPGRSLDHYAHAHRQILLTKTRLNRMFQTLIKHPRACDWIGRNLSANPARADAFIGVVGNVYSPAIGLKKVFFD